MSVGGFHRPGYGLFRHRGVLRDQTCTRLIDQAVFLVVRHLSMMRPDHQQVHRRNSQIRPTNEPILSSRTGCWRTYWPSGVKGVSPGRRTRCTTLCRQHQSFDVPAQYWRPECTQCRRDRHRPRWSLSNETLQPSSLPCFPDRPAGGGLTGNRFTTTEVSPSEESAVTDPTDPDGISYGTPSASPCTRKTVELFILHRQIHHCLVRLRQR